jgi:amino acid permease
MASLKITAVVGLILLGVVLLFRPNYEPFDLPYWKHHRAFADCLLRCQIKAETQYLSMFEISSIKWLVSDEDV